MERGDQFVLLGLAPDPKVQVRVGEEEREGGEGIQQASLNDCIAVAKQSSNDACYCLPRWWKGAAKPFPMGAGSSPCRYCSSSSKCSIRTGVGGRLWGEGEPERRRAIIVREAYPALHAEWCLTGLPPLGYMYVGRV